jgi:hypothetical protein
VARAAASEGRGDPKLSPISIRPRLKFLPVLGAGSIALAHLLTAAAFRRRMDAIFARLQTPPAVEQPPASVPTIVTSYLQRALCEGPTPSIVWLRQTGEMRPAPNAPWRPFTAEQVINIRHPGFAWLARMQVMPLLSADILDCYVDGEGLLEARLCGLWPLARLAGPEVSKGELMRYLAELAWAPHAMLYNPQLSWRVIDAATVEVSARSAHGPARVRLAFENGDIARMEAYDRPRAIGRRIVPTRWRGWCSGYREIGGCRVPTQAGVSWLLDGEPFEYWHGKITAFDVK